jgi:TFIIF-interacting CTD phosphatase-like protein
MLFAGAKMAGQRILLILDIDETLIHAVEQPLPHHHHDFVVGPYRVYRRPRLHDFLKGCSSAFDMAFWSSATSDYVEAVVSSILPDDITPQFVWARQRCVRRFDFERHEVNFLKDLRKVKRQGFPLAQVLIVDDEPVKLSRSYGNAIYVRPFTGQPDDDELLRLLPYLLSLQHAPVVRRIEKRGWRCAKL